jgi:hypothetical protein
MFGLTARKPNLGGKVFVPQKPAPKPTTVIAAVPPVSTDVTEVARETKVDSFGNNDNSVVLSNISSSSLETSVVEPSFGSSAPVVPTGTQPKISILPGAKPLAKKVSFAPVSNPKKNVSIATTSETPKPDQAVDTIMESAKVLQQLATHQLNAAPQATTSSIDTKTGSGSEEDSQDDDDEALAVHFLKPNGKTSSKAAGGKRVNSQKRNSKQINDTTAGKDAVHPISTPSSSSSSSAPSMVPPALQRFPSNSSTVSDESGVLAGLKRQRTPKSPSETTPRSPRSVAAKKPKASLHIFPLSYGNPTKIQRLTSYVRINQDGVEGLTFVNEDERPVVAEIAPTFANTAGIQVRDVVISVNNLDAKYAKFDQLMNALICKNPPSPKDTMELTGIIEKNSTYDSIACIVFARPIPV